MPTDQNKDPTLSPDQWISEYLTRLSPPPAYVSPQNELSTKPGMVYYAYALANDVWPSQKEEQLPRDQQAVVVILRAHTFARVMQNTPYGNQRTQVCSDPFDTTILEIVERMAAEIRPLLQQIPTTSRDILELSQGELVSEILKLPRSRRIKIAINILRTIRSNSERGLNLHINRERAQQVWQEIIYELKSYAQASPEAATSESMHRQKRIIARLIDLLKANYTNHKMIKSMSTTESLKDPTTFKFIAHEINNIVSPLGVLYGTLSVIIGRLNKTDTTEVNELAKLRQKYAETQANIVSHVAYLEELVSVNDVLHPGPYRHPISALINNWQRRLNRRFPQLKMVYEFESTATCQLNSPGLYIVINTLLQNTDKYGRIFANGALNTSMIDVTVRVEEIKEGYIQVSITDPGQTRLEDTSRVFDLGYRDPAHRKIDGTGFGLSVVKEYAENHGGSVSFMQLEDAQTRAILGHRITISLPIATQ